MTEFEGPRRYVDQAEARFGRFMQAARDYPERLPPGSAAWLLRKPLDSERGNRVYVETMYRVLNLLGCLDLAPGSLVVDAGAGPGWIAEILLSLGHRVRLIEPSPAMLDVARERFALAGARWGADLPGRAEFVATSLEELPDALAGVGDADAVLFHEAFHHVIDEHRAARQAFGLLRPGGTLAIIGEGRWEPGNRSKEAVFDEEMERFGTLESPFTPEYLQHVLTQAGFVGIRFHHAINGLFPIDTPALSLHELAGDGSAAGQNCVLAHRPGADAAKDAERSAAAIAVTGARMEEPGQLDLAITVRNVGQTRWLADGPRGGGLVTIALTEWREGDDGPVREAQRARLPGDVAPGEEVALRLRFDVSALTPPLVVRLVSEGSFWFAARAVVPAPA